MTNNELRRKYLATCPVSVSDIVSCAFDEDDSRGAYFNEEDFMDYFVGEACDPERVREAWEVYRKYHVELAL